MDFKNIIKSGDLEKAKKYLIEHPKYDIHYDYKYADVFRDSCGFGHLEVAKWLYELDVNIDIHARKEEVFRISCGFGYLEMAKWLYGLDGKIDIHIDNEDAFRWSCSNGHLDVAKLLYELDGKTDIHAGDDEAFCISCSKGHIDMAMWLYGLDKEYYNEWIIEDKIENEKIRDKIMEMRMKESKLYIGDDVEISI
jgi:hypothetical protein